MAPPTGHSSSLPNAVKPSGLNSTAYRIFRLLQGLLQGPMTVEAMNQAFLQDALVGKAVSNDTLWLYLNTLKQLGCELSRPSASNGYQYELLFHPFGLNLTHQDLACLAQLKMAMEKVWPYQKLLKLDELNRSLLQVSCLPNANEQLRYMFEQTRSIDYTLCKPLLEAAELACKHKTLVELVYESSTLERKTWLFLPLQLLYQNGALYLLGLAPKRNDAMALRIDRLKQLTPVSNLKDEDCQALLQRLNKPTLVELNVFTDNEEAWQPLHPEEQHTLQYDEATGHPVLHVRFYTFDLFTVKQRLLQCPLPIECLAPASLKEELATTLNRMLNFYLQTPQPEPPSAERLLTNLKALVQDDLDLGFEWGWPLQETFVPAVNPSVSTEKQGNGLQEKAISE